MPFTCPKCQKEGLKVIWPIPYELWRYTAFRAVCIDCHKEVMDYARKKKNAERRY